MTTAEPQYFNVFVYGSLRPTLYNFDMAAPALVADPRPAIAHGYTLHSNHGDSFPYLARGVEEGACGDVHGEVLTLELGVHLRRIVAMEEGAGYNTEIVTVDVEQEDGTMRPESVIAFVHDDDRKSARGTIVPDGNWLPFYAAAEARHEHSRGWRFNSPAPRHPITRGTPIR